MVSSINAAEEDSGSEDESLQYNSSADFGFRNRRKKKQEMQNRSSQSLFSIVLNVGHGLVALQTHSKVTRGRL